VAVDDEASTDEDLQVIVPVLVNDSDVDGDTLVVSNVTQGSNGSVANNADSVTYLPNPNYNGADSFGYTVSDGADGTATATVTVTIRPVNDVPTVTANAPAVSVSEGQTAANSGPVFDVDGDPITLSASLGTVNNNGNGTWSWSLATTDDLQSQVTIFADDGQGGLAQVGFSLTVSNVPPTVNAGADMMITSGATVGLSATFTDPGADTYSSAIDWGDSTSEAGIIGAGTVTGAHPYLGPRTYTVTVCVTDDDGGTGCDNLTVQVSPLTVTIDIKPGSYPNSINLGSGGNVPVAILGSPSFDATSVDPTTVRLASAPVQLKGKGTSMASVEDVNGDGIADLVVHVSTEALQLSESDTEAVLEGQTFGGVYIRGVDTVRVVP
jgi:hypothetical protein